MPWLFEGKSYTKREFHSILVKMGQTIKLSETNEDYIKEYEKDDIEWVCPIFIGDNGCYYAVVKG